MRRLDKPYKLFILRHFLAVKRVLILILMLEAVLIGREIIFDEPKEEGVTVQQDAAGGVLGEKEGNTIVNGGEAVKTQPSPTVKPQVNKSVEGGTQKVSGANQASAKENKEAEVERNIAELVKLDDFDSLVPYGGDGHINLSQGSIAFEVLADWGEGDRTLLLANFNVNDSKNLFELTAGGNLINFETYDQDGQNGKEIRSTSFEEDLQGKLNKIKISWNFEQDPMVKRIYINDKLVQEANVENVPTGVNSTILMGKIENLIISDKWE